MKSILGINTAKYLNYSIINKYIVIPQPNAINPKHLLDKITKGKFKYFASIYAKNAFNS
jgi:hypothetical protein